VYHDTLCNRFATWASRTVGHPTTLVAAALTLLLWTITGPILGFSNTWQLAVNTGTTITTFIMVFLVQSNQNRDSITLQLKFDELILATSGARYGSLDLENLSNEDLARNRARFEAQSCKSRENLK
jgi:low affinity Fe/Cu permease